MSTLLPTNSPTKFSYNGLGGGALFCLHKGTISVGHRVETKAATGYFDLTDLQAYANEQVNDAVRWAAQHPCNMRSAGVPLG